MNGHIKHIGALFSKVILEQPKNRTILRRLETIAYGSGSR